MPALSRYPLTETPETIFFLEIILKYWNRTFHNRKNFIGMGLNLVIHLHKITSGKSWLLYSLGGKNSFLKWFSRLALFKIERLSLVSIQGMVLFLMMYCQHLLNACPGRAVTVYLQCYSEILKGNSRIGYSETTETDSSTACLILTLPEDRKHSAYFHHYLLENQSCHFLVN